MNVLIIQNVTSEGPGTIADHLRATNTPSVTIDLQQGQSLPPISPFTHVVILGGPMAVYEMDATPYLRDETRFVEEAVRTGRHVLGVCLGAQMLAHVLGSRVYPGGQKEIGWYDATLTEAGMSDPVTGGLSVAGTPRVEVFQWHGDTFDLPNGASRLASSKLYSNQAFRYGRAVYGLQFHIEVTPQIVRSWLAAEAGIDRDAVHADSERIYPAYRERADRAYVSAPPAAHYE